MTRETIIQLIGYFSTLLILISFLMTSVVKLRLLNLAGAIMNIGLCLINIYFLIRLARSKSLTTMLPIKTDHAYLKTFLDFYKDDIRTYFPNFSPDSSVDDTAYFVYYDMNPVGLILGRQTGDRVLDISLDYTIPKYRDASVGRYLYPHLLGQEGFSALEFRGASEKHEKYLRKIGFRQEDGCYRMTK